MRKLMFTFSLVLLMWSHIGGASNGSSTVLRGYQCGKFTFYVVDKSDFRNLAINGVLRLSVNFKLQLPMERVVLIRFIKYFQPGFILVETLKQNREENNWEDDESFDPTQESVESDSQTTNRKADNVTLVNDLKKVPSLSKCVRSF